MQDRKKKTQNSGKEHKTCWSHQKISWMEEDIKQNPFKSDQ